MPDIPKRARIGELDKDGAGITDISAVSIRKHIKRHGIKKGKDGKYNTKQVLNAILEDRKSDKRNLGNNSSSPYTKVKTTKGALECQILQVKLDRLRADSIPISEYRRDLAAYSGLVNSVFDHFIEQLKNVSREKKTITSAKKLVERCKNLIRKKINALGD